VWHNRWCVGGPRILQAMLAMPPSCQKYPSWWCNAYWWWWGGLLSVKLCFSSFSLSSPKNYSLTLFVVGISTLVLIFLFSKFCSWLFCISFICFQFHHSILICHILYFVSIWFSIFWFYFFRPFVGFHFLLNFTCKSFFLFIILILIFILLICCIFLGSFVELIFLFNFI
jgi:hypothetical protein